MGFKCSTYIDFQDVLHVENVKPKINTQSMRHYGTYGRVYEFGSRAAFHIDKNKVSIYSYVSRKNISSSTVGDLDKIDGIIGHEIMAVMDRFIFIFKFFYTCVLQLQVIQWM